MSSYSDEDAFESAIAKPSLSQQAMGMNNANYLEGLNDAQLKAVKALDGPVLMLAGAGTGKTKTLMTRVAHLIRTGRAQSNEILSVTFTNKAAKEMRHRLEVEPFGINTPMKWMGTFHSLCVKQLRSHAELVGAPGATLVNGPDTEVVLENSELSAQEELGPPVLDQALSGGYIDGPHLKSNFTILDTDDQLRLLKQLIRASDIDEKRWPPRLLAGIIDGWKNKAWNPDQVPTAESSAFDGRGIELYAAYQRRLIELNACDFGDLLLHMVTIFQTHADILAKYQRWYKYILVDEYQDTNVAQYLWLRLLAQGHKNICCVGDDDQSIYGWRGAEVGNILRFEKDFPGAHVVRLEQNYRSTGHILGAAAGVIDANTNRLGKTLFTAGEDGEQVRLIGHMDGDTEARWIGEEIESMQRGTRGLDPIKLNSMAILVRASHQMRAFEDRFLTIGLPYRVIGGPRFYERLEIRDALAYFRLAVSQDDDLAFERIVNTPKRGLGDKAVQTIQVTARSNGVNLVEGARICVESGLIKGKGATALRELVQGLDRWHRQVIDEADTHIELAGMILDESGYTAHWQNTKTPEAPGRLENLKELVVGLEGFENLQGFLEHISLIMDNAKEENGDMVTIMTLHGSKGLEFPAVFLPGWEEGIFPSQRSMDESGLKGLEEERRLAYVGITRAEKHCLISFVSNRQVFGRWQNQAPSRFIDELPHKHVEVLPTTSQFGMGFGGEDDMEASIHEKVASADVYNSPGWRRLQSRQQQRSVSQPQKARGVTIDMTATSSFTTGERVFHQKFGYGEVIEIEGDKLVIEFDKAGEKKVVGKFIVSADKANDVPF